ncbi:MAG: hypothetical protein HY822_07800, partial [Acidobacteria bacterium]|nr:hypothetical protein [Acidobacteriota bacterium]
MRIRLLLLATMPVCSLCAQGLGSPRLGWMPDASGALRPLEGIAGAVTLGERAATDVLRAASSENWVLAQTAREILALPRLGAALARFPAPDGGAQFAFDREGEPAAVCFPSAKRLLLWKDGRFEYAAWKPPGGVLALAATGPGALSFLVLREASVWRVDVSPAGEVSLPLPGVGPPA